MAESCPFCERIATGGIRMDHAGLEAAFFEPLNPVVRGHLLVVPLRHVRDAVEDPALTGLVMEAAARLARYLSDCNLITSVGPAATQTVSHLHIHVVPRRSGDGLALPWTGQNAQPVAAERMEASE